MTLVNSQRHAQNSSLSKHNDNREPGKTNKHLLMVNILNLFQFLTMRHINDQKLFKEPEVTEIADINQDLTLSKV